MKSIHVLETVKLSDGKIDIDYNCYSKKLESGINGEVCLHVALLYIVEGIASPKPKPVAKRDEEILEQVESSSLSDIWVSREKW